MFIVGPQLCSRFFQEEIVLCFLHERVKKCDRVENSNSILRQASDLSVISSLPRRRTFDPAFREASVRVTVTIFARVRPFQKENCNRMHRK
jgi:hypothetical protein